MRISKSLFVAYGRSPKLARFMLHDRQGAYQRIQEEKYGSMDGKAIGDSVEDAVKSLLLQQGKTISKPAGNYSQARATTQQLSKADHIDVLEQGRFETEDFRCATDLLVRDKNGKFELREIKAKNTIRNSTKAKTLKEDLRDDVSFQAFVLRKTLGDLFSGTVKLVHLNDIYKKNGELDLEQLIKIEDVTDELLSDKEVKSVVEKMQAELGMSEERFNLSYPYDGTNYIEYFGTYPPEASIRTGPLHHTKIKKLYELGSLDLLKLSKSEKELLKKKDGEISKALQFVELYQSGETVIDHEAITKELQSLSYPLFFYDYETIRSPIPLRNKTSSRQQVVVQYSVHKIEEHGKLTHREGLIEGKISDNKSLIDLLVEDLEYGKGGNYIVWNKSFENNRNTEQGEMYPEYTEIFKTINKKTYDLMDIFRKLLYFDRRFEGSASIKNVLPVLTDISYDDLEISNGGVASNFLFQLATGELEEKTLQTTRKDLLMYCKQDTWAMVAIWKKLLEKLQQGG